MTRVLIFSASGFIGRSVKQELERRSIGSFAAPSGILRAPRSSALEELLLHEDYSAILHLGGVTKAADFEFSSLYEGNLLPLLRLAEALKKTKIRAHVYSIGSAAELGKTSEQPVSEDFLCRPHTHYGLSKWTQHLAIQLLREQGMGISNLRLFNVAGPGMSEQQVPACFVKKLKRGEKVLNTGPLNGLRDYMQMNSAARIIVDLLEAGWAGELIHLCTGQGTTARQFVRELGKYANFELRESRDPVPGSYDNVGDPSLLKNVLGYTPKFSVEECIRQLWENE